MGREEIDTMSHFKKKAKKKAEYKPRSQSGKRYPRRGAHQL